MPLAKVIAERPDVFNHNVEVVPRLYRVARRGSEFAALLPCAASRRRAGRGRGHHQVRPDGRARRDPRGDGRHVRGAARERRAGAHGRAVPAPVRAPPAGRALLAPRRVRRSSSAPRYALGFEHVAAGPLVRSSYHADQHVPQPIAGDGPLATRRRRAAPTSRPPVYVDAHRAEPHPIAAAMTRLLVLAVALVFIARASPSSRSHRSAQQGFSLGSLLSVFILVLLARRDRRRAVQSSPPVRLFCQALPHRSRVVSSWPRGRSLAVAAAVEVEEEL